MSFDSTAGAPIPERVGRYEILLPIASGGMAAVYLARSRGAGGFEREVALKLTHAHLRDVDEFTADLLEEAKLVVRIKHPNVVPVLDADDDPLGLFLVMEYVEGDTLGGLRRRAETKEQRVPIPVAMRILLDSLAGLHAAHQLRDEQGKPLHLVHRDFSPQNILVGLDGTAKLTDFGIARAASRLGHTRTGLVKGKIAYMAPEQARSQDIDCRCDVWAGGVIAWEMIAGRRLYSSESEVATLLRVVTEPPPLLRTLVPDLPASIEQVVAHALTMELQARVPSAQAFARELEDACRAARLLATHEEVSEYMQTTVGPKLEQRRARAAEIIRLRAKMAKLHDRSIVSTGDMPRIEVGGDDNPSTDDVGAGSRDASAMAAQLRAAEAATLAPPAPATKPSPSAVGRGGSQGSGALDDRGPTEASGPSAETSLSSSATIGPDPAFDAESSPAAEADAAGLPRRRRSRVLGLVGGVGAVILLGLVIVFGRSGTAQVAAHDPPATSVSLGAPPAASSALAPPSTVPAVASAPLDGHQATTPVPSGAPAASVELRGGLASPRASGASPPATRTPTQTKATSTPKGMSTPPRRNPPKSHLAASPY